MPAVPNADLTKLRQEPHQSRLYLIVQAAERWDSTSEVFETSDFVWYGTIKVAPATDPTFKLEVTADAASPGQKLFDRMTIFVSSTGYGHWDRAILSTHGDQTVLGAGADDDIYIAVSSGLSDIQVGDYVVVLDDFRFWLRFPKITESGGDLTWYKDYGYFKDSIGEADPGDLALTWAQLGADDGQRRQASMPPVPIMGPHVVEFIDPDVGSVDIDFDWSDTYSITSGVSVDAWLSWGDNSHAGGTWNDNVENPAAKTYSNISGLRGFKVWLEPSTDGTDMLTAELRRGIRWVFTLRRPEDVQAGDPSDAAPITDFALESLQGSYEAGGWSATIRVFDTQASEYSILPGALVILFTEDTYGADSGSVGPDYFTLEGRENILFTGYVADDSITKDSETGDVTFNVLSLSELMKVRENYPVPIEYNGSADEWYKADDLTIDRAAQHYLTWHTTLKLLADIYQTSDSREIKAMDFLAGDAYSTIDQFLWDRIFARMLCDRFGRISLEIDRQMGTAAAGTTMYTLASGDWIGELTADQIIERPTSTVDLGGLNYGTGKVTPYLSHAPGEMSRYTGTPEQMTSTALTDQAELNTLSGRLLAYRNNEWPRLSIPQGNWRVADIWPQEYVVVSEDITRHEFSSDLFIAREFNVEYDPDAGALFVTTVAEMETDGPDGVTVDIPGDIPPPYKPPYIPPPYIPPNGGTGEDIGRRIVSTDQGVFVTDEIGDVEPYWYAVNNGFSAANDYECYGIARDPFRWWTVATDARRLYVGNRTGIWYMDTFPNGTWTQQVTYAQMLAHIGFGGDTPNYVYKEMINLSVEVQDLYAFACYLPDETGFPAGSHQFACVFTVVSGAISTSDWFLADRNGNEDPGHNACAWAQHSGGQKLYATLMRDPWGAADFQAQLHRSLDQGASWTQLDITLGWGDGGEYGTVDIPYVDAANTSDRYIIWGAGSDIAGNTGRFRRSDNEGITWADIPNAQPDYNVIGAFMTPDRIFVRSERPDITECKWTIDGGTSYTELPLLSAGGLQSEAHWAAWEGDVLQNVLMGGAGTGAPPAPGLIYYWSQGLSDWVDKTGNLASYGATVVRAIDRDSTGAA